MSDNKSTLKLSADPSEILKAIKDIQQAATKLQKDLESSLGGVSKSRSAQGAGIFGETLQQVQSRKQTTREVQKGLEDANKEIEKQKRLLEELKRLQAEQKKNVADEFATKKRIREEEEKLVELKEASLELDKRSRQQNQTSNIKGGAGQIGSGGVTSLSGLASFMGIPASAVGGAMTAVAAGSAAEGIRKFFGQANNRALEAQASGFQRQGQGGQRLQSILSGGVQEELMFNSLRGQAAKNAEEEMRGNLESQFRVFSRPLQTLLGRGSTHKTGEAPGAFVIDQFGFGTENVKKKIEAEQYDEQAAIQAKQFEALKNGPDNFARTAAGNTYLQEWRRNLGFQRQTGLNENDFRGGYLGGIHGAGFGTEQGLGMSSTILGAGGSTRSATGNAAFALQMQRIFDLTNSGQALGALSGQLGSSQASKEALIKIQAEGTRIGLNQSEFREENRKFVEMAAGIINQSNVTSGAGVDQLVGTLGRFMGEKTMTGMSAGLSAYQAYQSQTNTMSGPSAVMRAAGIMNDPLLKQLSAEDQAALFGLGEAGVNVDDPGIIAMAEEYHTTAKELVDHTHKIQNSSIFHRPGTDVAISDLSKKYKSSSIGPVVSGNYGANLHDITVAEGKAVNKIRNEDIAKDLDPKAQLALVRALAIGDDDAISKILEESTKQQAESGKTGRAGDDMERQQAEADRLANGLFQTFKDSIAPASAEVIKFAGAIDILLKSLGNAENAQQRADALKFFHNQYPGVGPTNQPTVGPTPNGGGFHMPGSQGPSWSGPPSGG